MKAWAHYPVDFTALQALNVASTLGTLLARRQDGMGGGTKSRRKLLRFPGQSPDVSNSRGPGGSGGGYKSLVGESYYKDFCDSHVYAYRPGGDEVGCNLRNPASILTMERHQHFVHNTHTNEKLRQESSESNDGM